MRVWVVVCDSGLNGAWCDSAWSTQKAAEQRTAEVNRNHRLATAPARWLERAL